MTNKETKTDTWDAPTAGIFWNIISCKRIQINVHNDIITVHAHITCPENTCIPHSSIIYLLYTLFVSHTSPHSPGLSLPWGHFLSGRINLQGSPSLSESHHCWSWFWPPGRQPCCFLTLVWGQGALCKLGEQRWQKHVQWLRFYSSNTQRELRRLRCGFITPCWCSGVVEWLEVVIGASDGKVCRLQTQTCLWYSHLMDFILK